VFVPDNPTIAQLKAELDALRPLAPGALNAVQHHFDVDLTYNSNAIEGNTLTLRETAEVIDHGITVGGKRLKEHLEAKDLHAALLWMRAFASDNEAITEAVVRQLHSLVVATSEPEIAGTYSKMPRRIQGSAVQLPNPFAVPDLMRDFGTWLQAQSATPETAFEAHYRLVSIHPFSDGNGRTARLLMNLVLVRGGYPPISVRPQDRAAYLDGLERAQLAGVKSGYETVMYDRLTDTLVEYIAIVREGVRPSKDGGA
jgi:Fic family protein